MRVDVQGRRKSKLLVGTSLLGGLNLPPSPDGIGLKISAKIWWGPVPTLLCVCVSMHRDVGINQNVGGQKVSMKYVIDNVCGFL